MPEEKETTEVQQQPPKKSKTLLFVIIGAIVLLLIIGIVLFVLFLSKGEPEEPQNETPQANVSQNIQKKPSGSRQSDYMNIGPLYAIPQPFIVNLITQSGRRYLKTSITLELSNQKLENEVNAKITIIQDTIIEILSSKSIEEIATTKGKDRLKDEIASHINDFLIDGFIKNVFFTDFVIQ